MLDGRLLALPTCAGIRRRTEIAAQSVAALLPSDRRVSVMFVNATCGALLARLVPSLARNGADIQAVDGSREALSFLDAGLPTRPPGISLKLVQEDLGALVLGLSDARYQRADFIVVDSLLDYLPDRLAAALIGWVRDHLAPGGVLVLTGLAPSADASVLDHVFGWLVRRSAPAMRGLAEACGLQARVVAGGPRDTDPGVVVTARRASDSHGGGVGPIECGGPSGSPASSGMKPRLVKVVWGACPAASDRVAFPTLIHPEQFHAPSSDPAGGPARRLHRERAGREARCREACRREVGRRVCQDCREDLQQGGTGGRSGERRACPAPAEMEALANAGIKSRLGDMVSDRDIATEHANLDQVAVRTGVVLADLVLTAKEAPKEKTVHKLEKLKKGFAKVGAGNDIQVTIDEMIASINNDALKGTELVQEMDELSGVLVPELETEAGDWVVPLIQAGSWLEGAHLVSGALKAESKFDAADGMLRQPAVVDYFIKYVEREGGDKAPDEVVASSRRRSPSRRSLPSRAGAGRRRDHPQRHGCCADHALSKRTRPCAPTSAPLLLFFRSPCWA